MSVRPQSVEAVGIDGNGIRVLFFRIADRFTHRIETVRENLAAMALESVEGDDQDGWPPSPPLQQLTVENRDGNRTVALLVGAAGRTHWSVSVESDPVGRHITFDVACRLGESPQRLSSSYWIPATIDQALQLDIKSADASLPTVVERDGGLWVVRPASIQPGAGTTVRWNYRVSKIGMTNDQ